MNFLYNNEKGNTHVNSYWIGGSTDADKGSTIDYNSDYHKNGSGNSVFW